MKNTLKLMFLGLILSTGCSKPSSESANKQDSLKMVSKALYNQARDIHDEVMPKMDKLFMLKKSLKDTLANTSSIPPAVKSALEARIQLIDSAEKSMMDWMHDSNLQPSSDTANQEAYQQYMKAKVESAEQMKALILEALKKDK